MKKFIGENSLLIGGRFFLGRIIYEMKMRKTPLFPGGIEMKSNS